MQNSLLGFALVVGCATGFTQAAPQPVAVPEHTPVEIELEQDLSSETLHAGQQIAFHVVRDVLAPGGTVIVAGTPVTGQVSALESAGAFRKAGWFDLRLKPVRLVDGSSGQLEFPKPKLRSSKGEKAGAGAAMVPVLMYYFPLIPFAVAENSKKGAACKVRAGERYLVYLSPQPSREPPDGTNAQPKAQASPQ